jgi:hypothetical protein
LNIWFYERRHLNLTGGLKNRQYILV